MFLTNLAILSLPILIFYLLSVGIFTGISSSFAITTFNFGAAEIGDAAQTLEIQLTILKEKARSVYLPSMTTLIHGNFLAE